MAILVACYPRARTIVVRSKIDACYMYGHSTLGSTRVHTYDRNTTRVRTRVPENCIPVAC